MRDRNWIRDSASGILLWLSVLKQAIRRSQLYKTTRQGKNQHIHISFLNRTDASYLYTFIETVPIKYPPSTLRIYTTFKNY